MIRLEISYRGLAAIAAIVVLVWALIEIWPILFSIFAAFIFMAALLPYVEWLTRRGIPRTASVFLVILVLLAILSGLFALVVPTMVSEFKNLRSDLPQDARRLEDFLGDFGIEVELEERARNINWEELLAGRVVDYGQRIVFTIISVVTIVVLTIYLLLDAPRMSAFLYRFVPSGREPELDRVLQSLGKVVGGYIRGQAITSLSIALYTLVVLLAVDVPNAIAFAVLAAFVDIIPIIGAVIAIFFPTLVAFRESTTQAIIVMAALVAYQQFEDRVLVPRVYGQTLNLPPIVVLIAVLVGGRLFGIPGVLLALPSTAIARIALDYFMEKRQLPGLPEIPMEPENQPLAPDNEEPTEEPSGEQTRSR